MPPPGPNGSLPASPNASARSRRRDGVRSPRLLDLHGRTGEEGPSIALVGGDITTRTNYGPISALAVRGEHLGLHPPRHALRPAGILTDDEAYAVTAYLLYRNGIIDEEDVMDAQTLPQVRMPRRDD